MSERKNDQSEIRAFTEETDFEVPESKDIAVPRWLILTYIILPIWGVFALVYYINGTTGWLDRGYWQQLQIAANTTFPNVDHDLKKNDK